MTAQDGSMVLIKIGDGALPEQFTTIGGLRTTRMTIDNKAINSTNRETGAWRQLLAASGLQSMSLSGTGLFTDSHSEETLRQCAFTGSINNYRFIFANGGYAAGAFKVTQYIRSGDYDAEELYAVKFESAGDILFINA